MVSNFISLTFYQHNVIVHGPFEEMMQPIKANNEQTKTSWKIIERRSTNAKVSIICGQINDPKSEV